MSILLVNSTNKLKIKGYLEVVSLEYLTWLLNKLSIHQYNILGEQPN